MVAGMVLRSKSRSYTERTHKWCACVERSKAEGIKQRAARGVARMQGNQAEAAASAAVLASE
eukprot:19262-Chlamydomonas_euryale.AAC.1